MKLLRMRVQPVMIIVCAVVWTLLWGELSIMNVLVGAALGLLIGFIFPMPPIIGSAHLRPLGLIWLALTLAYDLTRSSIAVMIVVLRFGHTPQNAIVGVQLRTRNDFYLTQVAELISLVPGTIVVEARQSSSTVYLHVLDVSGEDDLEGIRQLVYTTESRVVRAYGTRQEIADLRAGTVEQ